MPKNFRGSMWFGNLIDNFNHAQSSVFRLVLTFSSFRPSLAEPTNKRKLQRCVSSQAISQIGAVLYHIQLRDWSLVDYCTIPNTVQLLEIRTLRGRRMMEMKASRRREEKHVSGESG